MFPAFRPKLSPRLLWIVAALAVIVGAGLAVRFWFGGYAIRSVLRLAGASEIRHGAVRATPWRVEVLDLRFRIRTQALAARRVTLDRANWWMASLGDVRVEGARIPVVLDRSDLDPWTWSTYDQSGGLGDEAVNLPFRSLDLEGELVVRMATVPDMPVRVKLEGRSAGGTSWTGTLLAEGTGFRLAGAGSLLRAGQELDFKVHEAELDLAPWSRHIQRLVVLPGGPWELGGRLTGTGEGRVTARRFAATARVGLRGGRMQGGTQDVTVTGAEADLEFSDLWKLRTRSGELRLEELRVGRLSFRGVAADFGLWDGGQINVARAEGTALGGRIEADGFGYRLDQRVVGLTLRPVRVRLTDLLALTAGVTPRITGRADGVLPLRIHPDGVRLDGGQLSVQPGSGAELQLNPSALLRSGAQMDAGTQQVFRAAGASSVLVRLDTLRLELRPEGLPLGTTGRVEVGGTVDGRPVAFTFHVNGAVERYLRIMDDPR